MEPGPYAPPAIRLSLQVPLILTNLPLLDAGFATLPGSSHNQIVETVKEQGSRCPAAPPQRD